MGNQQERSSYDIGWLAGIIDGEGCLQIVKAGYKRKGNRRFHYQPQIVIGNTNMDLIDNVIRIFDKYNIPCYARIREDRSGKDRPFKVVGLYGHKRCNIFFLRTGIQLYGKSIQQSILQSFIKYRLSLPYIGKHRPPPNEKDENYRKLIMQANQQHKGEILRDYTPDKSL